MLYKEFEYEHDSGELIYFDLEYVVTPSKEGQLIGTLTPQSPPPHIEITSVIPRATENPCFTAMWNHLLTLAEPASQKILATIEQDVAIQAIDRISTKLIRAWSTTTD